MLKLKRTNRGRKTNKGKQIGQGKNMNQKKSIFIGLAMLMALFVTVVTFAGQSDQGLKAFEGQTNTSQNNTANTIKRKKNRGNSNTGMDSNMPMNSNTAPNTNGTPR